MILDIFAAGGFATLSLLGYLQFRQSRDTQILVTIVLGSTAIFTLAHGLSKDLEIVQQFPWVFALQASTAIILSVGFYLLCSTIAFDGEPLQNKNWAMLLLSFFDIALVIALSRESDLVLNLAQDPSLIFTLYNNAPMHIQGLFYVHLGIPILILTTTLRNSVNFYRFTNIKESKRRILQVWIGACAIFAALLIDIPGRTLELNNSPIMFILYCIGGYLIFQEGSLFVKRLEYRQNTMERYLPEDLLLQITLQERQVLEASRIDGVIMFCDIRDFTDISERTSSDRVVALLNDYYARMNEVIRRHGGIINKFIGDAILVIFDLQDEGSAARALHSARDMIEALDNFNREGHYQDIGNLEIGFGIHKGPLTVGHMGCAHRMEYTVIGDTVNIAARLAGMNTNLEEPILVSREYLECLTAEGESNFEFQGEFPLKGRKKKVHIFAA